ARTSTPIRTCARGAPSPRGQPDPPEGQAPDRRSPHRGRPRAGPLRPPLRRLAAAHRLMPTWDFDTPGVVRLDLEIPFGRIEIESAAGNTTHVSLEGNESVSRELIEGARVETHQRGEDRKSVV